MATVVIFHHVLGVTPGVEHLADVLRAKGHEVVVPDFFDGQTFSSIDDGFAEVQRRGFDKMERWANETVAGLPQDSFYLGISLGAMSAQRIAQTRLGAVGAILLEACIPSAEFGDWPHHLKAQIHGADHDPFFAGDGDLAAARDLATRFEGVQLFTYPGDQHLFLDSSLESFDADAFRTVTERIEAFLTAA